MTEDKAYCNLCECETKQDDDGCVWHQRISYSMKMEKCHINMMSSIKMERNGNGYFPIKKG